MDRFLAMVPWGKDGEIIKFTIRGISKKVFVASSAKTLNPRLATVSGEEKGNNKSRD